MKLTYLGTGNARSFPEAEGSVPAGQKRSDERDLRRPNCMLVDDSIILNLPEGLFSGPCRFLNRPKSVQYILLPHASPRHVSVEELLAPACPEKLTVLCTEETERYILDGLKSLGLKVPAGIDFIKLKPYETAHADEFALTPLIARRSTEEAYIHIIERNGKRLLCANDTGFFPEDTWDFLMGTVFDCISFDLTNFGRADTANHMTLEDNLTAKKRLFQQGCTHPGTRFISTHFPQDERLTFQNIHERLLLYGITAAYDGMTVMI
jgi:phosphoribosyl 1,2-cyclic phosphate phosphodiesterase